MEAVKWAEAQLSEGAPCTLDELEFSSHLDALWSGVLEFCSCGPDEPKVLLARVCRAMFDAAEAERFTPWYVIAPDLEADIGALILIYALDSAGVVTHGSGIRGAFLTSKGRDLLDEIFTGKKDITWQR